MTKHSVKQRRYRLLWVLGAVAALLVGMRIALPSIVKDYVNRRLMALEGYDGHVEDVDLALWRGAYAVDGVRIVRTGAKQATPFFNADRMELSVEWRSLLRGSTVVEGTFFRPDVNFVKGRTEQESQTGKGVDWADRLEDLSPFKVNTVKVVDGTITFRAPGIATRDALKATNVDGAVSNITNVVESGKETFAEFSGTATVLKKGSARVNGSANPLAKQPTFDVNLTVKNVSLPEVNPWLRQYIKADAESGEFELYTELAAADGKFKGYAKPIMHDVDMYTSEGNEGNFLHRIWEGIVEFATEVLENDDQDEQVAARIPFSGTIKDPDADIFQTIVSVMHNAFVSAFARSLEGSISLRDARKSLKEIGDEDSGGDDDGAKSKDKAREARRPDHGPKKG